jgi:uncharacterized membrane protein
MSLDANTNMTNTETFTQLFFEMALFAVLGLGFEVLFTSITDFKGEKRRFLMGYSSLWYAPLYACAPLFLHYAGGYLFLLPLLARGVVYALVIWLFEYVGMWLLRLLLGASPSEEQYLKSRWNIHGLIRLDFFPAMFLMGLAFEFIFRTIR